MKLLDLSISTLIIRFYLLMAIVIGAGFIGQWWLAILALPVFFSALMGMKFTKPQWKRQSRASAVQEMQHANSRQKKLIFKKSF